MANKLSHSATGRYMQCGESFRLHYQEKLRPIRQHAALLFGTAIDKAIETLLQGGDPYEVFNQYWKKQYLNDVQTNLMRCIDIVYAESDFDKDLFRLATENVYGMESNIKEFLDAVSYKEEKGYENIPDPIKELCNEAYWWCLKLKGKLMIDAFKRDILPTIKKVHSTQEQVDLENDAGDSVVGYIDAVVDLEGYDRPVIMDTKTSAREYKEESAIYSPQLSLYINAKTDKYNTRLAGYWVLSKLVIKNKTKICKTCKYDGSGGSHKTCPAEYPQTVETRGGKVVTKDVRCGGEWEETLDPIVRTQTIIDEIPIQTENLIMENIAVINDNITNGVFTKNLRNCLESFGRPCEFIGVCYKGDYSGLIKKEEKK